MANNPIFRIFGRDESSEAWASVQRNASGAIGRINGLLPGLGAALSAAGMIAFAKQTLDAGDQMHDLSQKTGLSVETLSRWKFVAEQSNATLESIQPGLKGLAQNMESAARSGGEAGDAFRRLGVPVKDGSGNLRQMDQVMLDLADRFSRMNDGTHKTALAVRIFGKAGQEMIPILNQGKGGIDELMTTAEKLGLVMSTEAAKAADDFKDSLDLLKKSGEALRTQLLEKTAPAISAVALALAEGTKQAGGFFGGLALLSDISPFSNLGQQIQEANTDLARLRKQHDELIASGRTAGIATFAGGIRALEQRIELMKSLQRQQVLAGSGRDNFDARDRFAEQPRARPLEIPTGKGEDEAERARAAAAAAREHAQVIRDKMQWLQAGIESQQRYDDAIQDAIDAGDQQTQADRQRGIDLARLIAEQDELFNQDKAATMQRRTELENDEAQRRQNRYIAVFDSLQTERGAIEQDFAQRSLALKDWIRDQDDTLLAMRDKGSLDDQAFNQKRIEANARYYGAMKRLDEQYSANKLKLKSAETQRLQAIWNSARIGELTGIANLFGEAVPLMQSGSRKMFEIGKGFALAQATVSMFASIQSALATVPFFPTGLAMGALAAAKGIMNIQGINSAQFGGGGAAAGTVGTFSASPSTGLPELPSSGFVAPPSPIEQRGVAAPQPRVVNLTLIGDGLVSQAWIRDVLIPELNEALDAGVSLR